MTAELGERIEQVRAQVRQLHAAGIRPRELLAFFDQMKQLRDSMPRGEYLELDRAARLELRSLESN